MRYVQGTTFDKEGDIPAAVAAARDSDLVILCLGEMSYAETPGNIDDLGLPDAQLKLADAVAATGKPVVLVLVEGRPRIVRTVVDRTAAILLALNPGHEGGTAITDVLTGDVNPSGRLPITYPRHANALIPYDHRNAEDVAAADRGGVQPQFPFGAGLSYTTFEYSGLTSSPGSDGQAGATDVSVTVRNTGSRAGMEVVQVYVTPSHDTLSPPVKRLKRFAKILLNPGESRQLRFRIGEGEETRPFTVRVGSLTREVQ